MSNALFDPLRELEWVKEFRRREYIASWLTKHRHEYPDDRTALLHCHPTDKDLDWPPKDGTFSVDWGTGGLVVTLDGLKKLPAKQRNAIYKLGGL